MVSHLGRYEIINELGRGAMGIVYKAHDPLIDRFVAIKTINLQVLSEDEKKNFKSRFYQEAKAAGHLNHPNIVTIHDLGESGDTAYIAMELMEGRELQAILDGTKRLSIEEALNIAIEVASGLFYAHQRGIVHRDIKPSNIMVLGNNHIKIADFGIAKMSTNSLTITNAGKVIGSPSHMSPEQIRNQPIDARSDIFSLGIVLYQMLTGRLPFDGENANSVMYQIVNEAQQNPSAFNPDILDPLDAIVSKCLAKNPDSRYRDARELADDLRIFSEELQRAKVTGFDHPLTIGVHFKKLKRLATPGAIEQNTVIIGSFLIIGILFLLDIFTDANIQLHLLYVFPLIVLGFHSETTKPVKAAIMLALLLQGITLAQYSGFPTISKLAMMIMVLSSNLVITYVARIARSNFLEVAKLASYDGLTGLRNLLSFEPIVEMEISKQSGNANAFSFVVINIDNLKELNETSGRMAGENLLKLLANIVQENIRQFDTAARISSDEFAILMPNTDESDCTLFCKQLSEIIDQRTREASLPVSTSIGHVTFKQTPTSISEIFSSLNMRCLWPNKR